MVRIASACDKTGVTEIETLKATHPRDRDSSWVSLADASRFWLQLGLVSFGGPAGQIALLHRELVERRRWLSEQRYLHALNYCMLLPGPCLLYTSDAADDVNQV
jgi:hypothetical protein